MRKPARKNNQKSKKDNFEDRLEQLVGEYRQAKEVLDSLELDDSEYESQKEKCDKLFANAERFINRQK
ncbi:hypothetical protein NI389_19200 (plasmid) [Pseudoalteromonas xiamenensis]|uniref:hypothetical protein n=1 Tax=Pseudoalteromonas xiamenensis TaxID=882626 RepID=UPI0027E3C0E3|nr:hypothetical protein [Pseudoalteromonas xiamenensis]WMN62296.1 hypothetical protein NI389_19200 [Pseudoalteromonas xiamenensis]